MSVFRVIVTVFTVMIFNVSAIAAQENGQSAEAATAQGEKYSINYADWDLFLSGAVLRAKSTSRHRPKLSRSRTTGSRFSSPRSAKSLEANRIAFKSLDETHLARLEAIQKDLTAVPGHVSFSEFSKDEQLAYWLNLHNISVLLEITRHYPVKNMKKMARGKGSVWEKKQLTVNGKPMSIRDMEAHILGNWEDPVVAYGLFMGAVGGPNLRHKAYTASTVYEDLRYNARDFVNSFRGLKTFGGKGDASAFYDLVQAHYPELKAGLKEHLESYARDDTLVELGKLKSLKVKQYDWSLADWKAKASYRNGQTSPNLDTLSEFAEAANEDRIVTR